ncbi:hypothetical protein [Umezawaea tangerina]|uniref:Uncharacterized protein n=1 Tax=Umezawaea tangerina TaxID=84725 RepID=A0A2T0T6J9_9PSEU|nr:hypothetical protein [Umezawaea tangerina]PRY41271.1 hypothetical protein CLV43_10529 [Umezawaea tangerina]
MTNTKTSRKHPVLLWTTLVVGGLCNAAASLLGLGVAVSIPFGLLTVACIVGLVTHYRGR